MDILKLVNKDLVVKHRRHFHMYPEVAFDEHETKRYIVEQIEKYPGVEIFHPTQTSVVATLKGGKPGGGVGLRADIDALPIFEEADVEFKSKNEGVMHACGHDCHAAMLLGALDVLYAIKDELCGTVKFIFQHAEEAEPGGASQIIPTGILNDVQAFYGAHVGTMGPAGTVYAAAGPIYANADFFAITVKGKGGHAASPHACKDTILIGAEVVQALNYIVSRNVPAGERAVLTVGVFHAGTKDNIIPETAEIKGTVRTYTPKIRELMEAKIKSITAGISAAYDAEFSIYYEHGYSAVVNDEELYKAVKEICAQYLPHVKIEPMPQIMGGEDFSAYGKIAPAFFAGIGSRPEGVYYEHHHPKFIVDEGCLPIGTALYAAFAYHMLNKN